MRLSLRAVLIALVVLAVTACGDHESNGSDMAVCDGRSPPASPTPCGPETCAVGQICFIEHPGLCAADLAAPLTDGGEGGGGSGGPSVCVHYRCVAPPADCDCQEACDSFEGASPSYCSFDGSTLSCTYD